MSTLGLLRTEMRELTAHETTRSILHPNTLVGGIWCGRHVEYDIPQSRGLGDLPMDTSSLGLFRWYLANVDDKILYHPEASKAEFVQMVRGCREC